MPGTFHPSPDLEVHTLLPGTAARFVHSESMTMAFWSFEPEINLPEHSHPHEQISTVLEGVFELAIDGEVFRLEEGDVAVIPSDAIHSGRSLTRCRVLDVFHPVREDLRKA